MSITRSRAERRPRSAPAAPAAALARLVPLVAVVALVALDLGGCSAGGDDPPGAAPAGSRDVVAAITRALDSRARVVRRADEPAFRRLIGGGRGFRDQQQTWFDNLRQLPVQTLRYRLDPGSVVREGSAYSVVVQQSLQLAGYDEAPVTEPDRWEFRPARHRPGRFLLTSVTDRGWEQAHEVRAEPWDLGPIEVREGPGVLGIFDPASVADAPQLLTSVESGIADVSATVPYQWSRSVVLYALSDPTYLDSIQDAPGDDPDSLDAVAFPAGRGTRFVLNPRMLGQAGPERDRLVRHELTHVAVGDRADGVPVWLSEGLAEYVSVRPLAPQDRRIPQAAVAAAETGADDLPDDASFNDGESQAHYGLAWWAVEYLADAYGEDAPWQLLDALAEPGADPGTVLHRQFGTSTRDLARQADRLILSLYDPSEGVL